MPEPIHFHTDLYRREALEAAAEKYRRQAHIELTESGADVVAKLQPLGSESDATWLRDEFSNEVFSATARNLRARAAGDEQRREPSNGGEGPAPWKLLEPFGAGDALSLGWMLESLSPVRAGAATLVLRHDQHGTARIAIRRNGGAPLGVAHTDHLDFLLMNGGSGAAQTEESIGRVLIALAHALRSAPEQVIDDELAALRPHAELNAPQGPPAGGAAPAAAGASRRVAPHIDLDGGIIRFELDEAGVSRLALYDAVLAFADRCYLYLTRPDATRIALQIKAREGTREDVRALAADVTRALNRVVRHAGGGVTGASDPRGGLPRLPQQAHTLDALVAELAAADPATLGVGFQPERGPGHEALRVLNIRGTGACNSDCVFCVEKFDPAHRSMPKADTVRQFILDAAGGHDMLFFASGEPTIHPKLFDYVELAKSVGFTAFGMSSHFRTFADPRFALRTLQAGFEYFDISLHAADAATQLDVNPIADDGRSLLEALMGLAVLYRLADALGIRISVTHKIVVSRLNVTNLEEIFRATFDRGVRHFILQPVRALNLEPERRAIVAITEEEILPHLNEFLRSTEHLGATIKPYGFSRQHLFSGGHVESEQNRVKNVYGRAAGNPRGRSMPAEQQRPNDGRHWIEVRTPDPGYRCQFPSTGAVPLLDDGLERGFDLPFGCRMGSCGMCCARLVEGRVDQNGQFFLTEEQVRDGFVLMCQARPLSDVVLRLCTDDELDPL